MTIINRVWKHIKATKDTCLNNQDNLLGRIFPRLSRQRQHTEQVSHTLILPTLTVIMTLIGRWVYLSDDKKGNSKYRFFKK